MSCLSLKLSRTKESFLSQGLEGSGACSVGLVVEESGLRLRSDGLEGALAEERTFERLRISDLVFVFMLILMMLPLQSSSVG